MSSSSSETENELFFIIVIIAAADQSILTNSDGTLLDVAQNPNLAPLQDKHPER